MTSEKVPDPIIDYWYEVTDEQIRDHLARTPMERLRWLDDARRFTLLARQGTRTYFKDGKPFKVVPGTEER